jgi:DNA-binding Xre family transcriptional regulator
MLIYSINLSFSVVNMIRQAVETILKQKKMTKTQLAASIGVSIGNFNGLLVNPTFNKIRDISAALDMPASKLIQTVEMLEKQ